MIDIEEGKLLSVLGQNGERWIKRAWEAQGGKRCLHGAIRACEPVPGDAYLVEQVANGRGWGPAWNDDAARTWLDIRARIDGGIHVTDEDLAETFGPQWREVVALVRRAAALTEEEDERLAAAEDAVGDAARAAAENAVWDVALEVTWDAAARAAAGAAGAAARALSVRHLIGQHGFTQEHYDTLTGPWRRVIGPVHPGDAEVSHGD